MRIRLFGIDLAINEKASATAPVIYASSAYGEQGASYQRNPAQYSDEAYRRNVIAYKAISEVARGAAKIPLEVYVRDKQADQNHPLVKLLQKPNPWQPKASFIEAAIGYWLLAGNTYLEGVGPDGKPPLELYTLRPDRTKVIPGKLGPSGYVYEVNGQKVKWDVDPLSGNSPILHLKFFNPLNDWYGMSPVEAAAFSVDAHNEAGRWNAGLLQNGARPSGALVYKGNGNAPPVLTDKQRADLKEQLSVAFSGGRNAGRPMLLDGGLEWQQMSMTPAEMDWLQGRHASSREIALAFGVAPQILAIPGDNTYSNMQEARQALYQDTILPLLDAMLDGLNNWLAPVYGDGVVIKANIENLPALASVRAARWQAVQNASWLTTNEKRKATGYEPISDPAGDQVLVSAGMIPLSDEPMDDGEGDDDTAAAMEDLSGQQPTDPAGGGVQATALNGAQIAALLDIVARVATGEISVETAEALVRISFPLVADAAVELLMAALAKQPVKPPEQEPSKVLPRVRKPKV